MPDKLPIVLRTATLGSEELRSTDSLSVGDNLSIGNNRVVDVADPVDDGDAVNLGYLTSNIAATKHSELINLLNNDHPQYVLKAEFDHGTLLGLADDDHAQYHNDARADTWLAAGHETTYNHTDIWGAGAEDRLWTQGPTGRPVSEAALTFNGTILTSPQYGSPDNIILVPTGTGYIQNGTNGNARGNYAIDLQADRANVAQVASGTNAVITGGKNNTNAGNFASIGGGTTNSITSASTNSVIGGGDTNSITASTDSVIAGGDTNSIPTACGVHNFIGGGTLNRLIAAATSNGINVIVGGHDNRIQGQRCVVGGGYFNHILLAAGVTNSVIGGGYQNTITAGNSVIGGGYLNTNAGNYSTVGGGRANTVIAGTGDYNTIAGGYLNTTIEGTTYNGINAISGGYGNQIQGQRCTISGGYGNKILLAAGARSSTIGGGFENIITAEYSTILGGQSNTVSGTRSVIVGGETNSATGIFSVIIGGRLNTVSAEYGTIPGGYYASSSHYGQSTQASGRFAATGDAQTSVLVARKQTTDATPTTLFLDGAGATARLTIPVSTSWFFTIKVIARQTNDDFSVNAYHIEGTVSRDAGNVAIDYQAAITSNEEDAAWDCVVSADTTNQALIVTVTGAAANNINWVARIELVETTG